MTDGIIFQPDRPYIFGRSYELFKWKWSTMRSIDLGVAIVLGVQSLKEIGTRNDQRIASVTNDITPSNVHLWCTTKDEEYIDCTKRGDANVALGRFDTFRLLSEYDDRRRYVDAARPIIAEVCYDAQVGMWSYIQVREDKTAPNSLDAVMGVFTEQAEGLSLQELEFIFLENESNSNMNGGDSFEDLLDLCKDEIIRLKRARNKL
jgi:hypothetical protein